MRASYAAGQPSRARGELPRRAMATPLSDGKASCEEGVDDLREMDAHSVQRFKRIGGRDLGNTIKTSSTACCVVLKCATATHDIDFRQSSNGAKVGQMGHSFREGPGHYCESRVEDCQNEARTSSVSLSITVSVSRTNTTAELNLLLNSL